MQHIPVSSIMFHTIGIPNNDWIWSFLTTPYQQFEGMLKTFKKLGYRTVLLDEYKELILSGKILKEKAVALTFDDGYLDNWTYAAPLLEKYNSCGTVFVTGDFINPETVVREQWNGNSNHKPFSDGFLNIAEVQALDSSRILDVQSHCMTHTWYPCSSKIIDFRYPNDPYHFMDWNNNPSLKWKYNQPPSLEETWGEPVYEHQKSLAGLRYFPNEEIAKHLRDFVAKEGKDFFSRTNWKEILQEMATKLQAQLSHGHYESEEDFRLRVEHELGGASRMLTTTLNKKPNWLCWPGGGYSEETFKTATKYYTGTTLASSSVNEISQGIDEYGCFRFRRFGALTVGEGKNFRYQSPIATCLYTEERRTANKAIRLVRGGITKLNQWNII